MDSIISHLKSTGKYWISFTGDSLTSCEWVHPNWRDIVLYVLQDAVTQLLDGDWKTAEWGIKGFNFAYDGATTKDVVEKLDDILLVKPQLLLCVMGGNDFPLGVGVDDSIANISLVCDTAIKGGTEVVWCSSTPAALGSNKNAEYDPYAQAFLSLPERPGLKKVDLFHIYQ